MPHQSHTPVTLTPGALIRAAIRQANSTDGALLSLEQQRCSIDVVWDRRRMGSCAPRVTTVTEAAITDRTSPYPGELRVRDHGGPRAGAAIAVSGDAYVTLDEIRPTEPVPGR